jgi:5'-3' exonuclease
MIVHGSDTFVLKDLARFAKAFLGNKAVLAPHDSESFIAAVVKQGDVGVTCDSDALPFGCDWTVQNIGTTKETWIKLDDILSGLSMTLDEFRIFCVLLGTDFNERLYMCGPAKVFPIIQHKRFTGFEDFCMSYGTKYSREEKQKWIINAELSLKVFQSEKI